MLGLRFECSDEFKKFVQIIQAEAEKKNSVFFVQTGDGDELTKNGYECETVWGWLIPLDKVSEFSYLYEHRIDKTREWDEDKWDDEYFGYVDWEFKGDKPTVSFIIEKIPEDQLKEIEEFSVKLHESIVKALEKEDAKRGVKRNRR